MGPSGTDPDVSGHGEIHRAFDELETVLDRRLVEVRDQSAYVDTAVVKLAAAAELVILARIAFSATNGWNEETLKMLLRELKSVIAPAGWG